MGHLAVTAVGADRPGIVAAVTEVLTAGGVNIEDSTMTILRGNFAMLLVVDAGDHAAARDLEKALAPVAARMQLVVSVRPVDSEPSEVTEGDQWTVSVYGADRPGIVHRVASLLASAGANIVDLTTRVIGDPARPVYAMVLDVVLARSGDAAVLETALRDLAAELGIECSMHPVDADIL